jgi:hypothetical protein
MKVIFIFLGFLFQILNGSLIEPAYIIERILTWPHDWLGITASLEFRDFVVSRMNKEKYGLGLPAEFRKRKYLLLYYYCNIKILKLYFSIKDETEEVKKLLDLIEEYYKFFFSMHAIDDKIKKSSIYELESHIRRCGEKEEGISPEALVKKAKIIKLISKVHSYEFRDVIYRITEFTRTTMYISHVLELKKKQLYSKFGLKEHGSEEELNTQLDNELEIFNPKTSDVTLIHAADYIRSSNQKYYSDPLEFYIIWRKNCMAIYCAMSLRGTAEQQALIERHGIYYRLSRYFSTGFIYEAYDERHDLCKNMIKYVHQNNLTTTVNFFELCYEKHSELFADISSSSLFSGILI